MKLLKNNFYKLSGLLAFGILSLMLTQTALAADTTPPTAQLSFSQNEVRYNGKHDHYSANIHYQISNLAKGQQVFIAMDNNVFASALHKSGSRRTSVQLVPGISYVFGTYLLDKTSSQCFALGKRQLCGTQLGESLTVSSGLTVNNTSSNLLSFGSTPQKVEAGKTINVPVTISLMPSQKLDSLSFSAKITSSVSASNSAVHLTFTQSSDLPSPSLTDSSLSNSLSVAWLANLSPALSGNKVLGTINFPVPTSAQNGQSYTIAFSGALGSIGSATVTLGTSRALQIVVGSTTTALLPGDPSVLGACTFADANYDYNDDCAINTLDLVNMLRVAVNIATPTPGKIYDINSQGGPIPNTLDLVILLRRAVNICGPTVADCVTQFYQAGVLNNPTLSVASPTPKYVIGGSSQAVGTLNFVASQASVTITEMGFTIDSSLNSSMGSPIASLSVAGQTAPVIPHTISASATVTGLNLVVPTSFAGLDVPVTANYVSVGVNGIPSAVTSTVKLSYVKYVSSGTTHFIYPPLSTYTMELVAGKPIVNVLPSSATLTTGLNYIGTVSVSADSGTVGIYSLPISVALSAIHATTTMSANQVVVMIHNTGVTIPTTDSGFSSTSGGSDLVKFNSGWIVPQSSFATFDIYIPVSGDLGTSPSSSVAFGLRSPDQFDWTDISGGGNHLTTDNITYLNNYPINTVSIHN